jgi:hypothetical protein
MAYSGQLTWLNLLGATLWSGLYCHSLMALCGGAHGRMAHVMARVDHLVGLS